MAVSINFNRRTTMRTLLLFALLALAGTAQATNNHNNEGGCRGNCEQPSGGDATAGAIADADANATATAISGAIAAVDVDVKNSNTNVVGVSNDNRDYNSNTNVAYGGKGGDGGNAYASGGDAYAKGGNAEQDQRQSQGQSQGQLQGQSQSSDNSNSSNNSSSQSTSLTFESTGEAKHTNRYGNNVSAYAPAIYSSSACTAGGLSGGASAMGVGVSLGGAKQDVQCQVRENARILSGLDPGLALMYLCQNDKVDIGAVLGAACKYTPPVVLPEPEPKPEPEHPIEVVTDDVKGK
jgi:hypothetical protein